MYRMLLAAVMTVGMVGPGWGFDLGAVVPRSDLPSGWRLHGQPTAYTRATLFDYINGAADFYFGYDFRRVVVAEYVGPGGAKITLDLYDMGLSYDAFGVFAHDRSPTSVPVGQESSWSGGLLTFWKDRLFARVFADADTPATRQAILTLGKAASTAVKTMGKKPPLLRYLPPGFAPISVRYLHTATVLNTLLYLPGNPLRLDRTTDVAYAEYPQAGERTRLMVIAYPDGAKARAGFVGLANLLEVSLRGAPSDRYVKHSERYQHAGALVKGRHLAVVASAPSQQAAERLLQAAAARIPAESR